MHTAVENHLSSEMQVFDKLMKNHCWLFITIEGSEGHGGRALNSESRGPGFIPHRGYRVVSISKTH